jgi:hypothetical protein
MCCCRGGASAAASDSRRGEAGKSIVARKISGGGFVESFHKGQRIVVRGRESLAGLHGTVMGIQRDAGAPAWVNFDRGGSEVLFPAECEEEKEPDGKTADDSWAV